MCDKFVVKHGVLVPDLVHVIHGTPVYPMDFLLTSFLKCGGKNKIHINNYNRILASIQTSKLLSYLKMTLLCMVITAMAANRLEFLIELDLRSGYKWQVRFRHLKTLKN